MRCALLYFGLLNTFDQIHTAGDLPNLPAALRDVGLPWDAYLDTSELSFLKIPRDAPTESVDTGGREIIDRQSASRNTERDYLVLRDPAEAITSMFLKGVRGASTTTVNFTPPDPATWTGPTLINSMILTFLGRKARIVRTAIAEAEARGEPYDILLLARPDSVFRPRGVKITESRGTQAVVTKRLAEDIERIAEGNEVGADFGGFKPEKSEPGLRLLANDLLVATPAEMVKVVDFFDLVTSTGRFNDFYQKPAFRCTSCRGLSSSNEAPCRHCGSSTWLEVTEWPEYKTNEHLKARGVTPFCLGVAGEVLRASEC